MGDKAENKVAVFAGIGRLGVPVAERLLDRGWRIAVSFRGGRISEKTAAKLTDQFGTKRVSVIESSPDNINDAWDLILRTLGHFGRIDALINIASGYPSEKDHWQRWQRGEGVTEKDWQFYESNFMVARNPITALLDAEQNPCECISIINFTDARSMLYLDDSILDPYENYGGILKCKPSEIRDTGLARLGKAAPARHVNPYALAKIDLVYLTRKLAVEYGPKVRVNAIAPGPMLAPPDRTEDEITSVVENTALKKWGGYTPIIQAVEYLLDNDFVTGEVLKVDGGMHLWARYHPK